MRYAASELVAYAVELLVRTGLDGEKANAVGEVLVEGDLLGHSTHGLQLLPAYLKELESGGMTRTGQPRVIADLPAAVTWDGMRLPGPWLTRMAVDLAMARARTQGSCTVVITRSHHIACLAAYLQKVADAGLVAVLSCSDPVDHAVAPFGGRRGVLSPNPIAAAWPTSVGPVIMDVSMSIASNGKSRRTQQEGGKFPAAWAIDAAGTPSDDPAVLFRDPPGALLPTGGVDHGHKGFALGLLVEALTSGLGGHGRADPIEGWSACVFVQVFDPALFGGAEAFVRQAEWMAHACHETPTSPGVEKVRLPGEHGLRRRAEQLRTGVALYPTIMPALLPLAERLRVTPPAPL